MKGWHGDSHGHSLAARGISVKDKKKNRDMSSFFLAKEQENDVSFANIRSMVRNDFTFEDMKEAYPDANEEDLRTRAIKAIGSTQGNNVLSVMHKNGTDATIRMTDNNPRFRRKVMNVLESPQMRSFISEPKAQILEKSLKSANPVERM